MQGSSGRGAAIVSPTWRPPSGCPSSSVGPAMSGGLRQQRDRARVDSFTTLARIAGAQHMGGGAGHEDLSGFRGQPEKISAHSAWRAGSLYFAVTLTARPRRRSQQQRRRSENKQESEAWSGVFSLNGAAVGALASFVLIGAATPAKATLRSAAPGERCRKAGNLVPFMSCKRQTTA